MDKQAIIISCFNWYKSRLEPVRELLLTRGYSVLILIADFDHINKQTLKDRYDECTYIHVPPYDTNLSFARIYSHLTFGKAIGQYLDEIQPDLIWLQMPPNNQARFCLKYKKNHPETKLIADIIDLWPESMPLGRVRNTPPAKIWRKWRDSALEAADHIFTECDLFRDELKLDPRKCTTLYLFKKQTEEERELVQQVIRDREQKNTIRLAYLGSMNNIIDIEGICSVIQKFISDGHPCELQAIGGGTAEEKFRNAAETAGCETHFHGIIFDEKEKIRILAPCDYALNMMKDTSEVGLTIKSIDYLSYGLPLLNNIKGDTWEMVQVNKIGMNIPEMAIDQVGKIDHNYVHDFFLQNFSKKTFVNNVYKQLNQLIDEVNI